MKKIIFVFVLLILALSFCFSEELTSSDLVWNGAVSITLDKAQYTDNEAITGSVRVDNLEEYPIVGGSLTIQVASGQFDYPSQFADLDNVVYETHIDDIWVLPKDSKEIKFSIPQIRGRGDYRVDVYVSVLRSKHTGASWIFLSPASEDFIVTGSEYLRAEIFRPTTTFNNTIGPVGFPVQPDEEITGAIVVYNSTTVKKSNMKLEVFLCDWSDNFCNSPQKTVVNVPDISAGEDKTVNVKLRVPTIPSAYAINMVLYSGDVIDSVYKNRVIVSGGTAKVRKVFIDGLKEKNYSIEALLSGSPDHFTNPDFNNFSLTIQALNGEVVVASDTQNYDTIKFEEVIKKKITVGKNNFDKVCVKVEKEGTTYDEVCFSVELEAIQQAYDEKNPELVNVDWFYQEKIGTVAITLTKDLPINADLKIFTGNTIIFDDTARNLNKYIKEVAIEKKNYVLIVDDLDAKRQQVFNLNFNLTEDEQATLNNGDELMINSTGEETVCSGTICSAGTVCGGQSYTSKEGACCIASCIPSNQSSDSIMLFGVPLIFWIAIIILLVAISIAVNTVKKVRAK